MTGRRWLWLPAVAALAACGGIKFYLEHAQSSCDAGRGDDCWYAGELWLHKASWSHYHSWPFPADRDKARADYERGCKLNSLRACAALVERHLLDDQPQRREEMLAGIESMGGRVFTDEEVATEDHALDEACEADLAQKAQQDREILAQALQQGMATLQQIGNNVAAATARPTRYARSSGSSASNKDPHKKSATLQETHVKSVSAGVVCPSLHEACGAGKTCCYHGAWAGMNLQCRSNMCCAGTNGQCNSDADCCDAPMETCSAPSGGGPNVCCKPSGRPATSARECCSGRLQPGSGNACM
jgi:hypothetical protein